MKGLLGVPAAEGAGFAFCVEKLKGFPEEAAPAEGTPKLKVLPPGAGALALKLGVEEDARRDLGALIL